MAASGQDDLNRRTWTKASSLRWLDRNHGFIAGEEPAFAHVRARHRGGPILELGVGTGPYAALIEKRFDVACARLGFDATERFPLDTSQFKPPERNPRQLPLFR